MNTFLLICGVILAYMIVVRAIAGTMKKRASNKARNSYVESLDPLRRGLRMTGICLFWIMLFGSNILHQGKGTIWGVLILWLIIYIAAWIFGLILMSSYKLSNRNHSFYSLPGREVINGMKLRTSAWSYMIIGILGSCALIVEAVRAA